MENTTSRTDMIMQQNKKKKTLGKQKIEMKKIEKMNYRYVTFSKRRAGLFKKAAELCLQTGAKIVALVTSPGNHTFAFTSQPNPEHLLRHVMPGNRYVGPTATGQLLVHDEMMMIHGENLGGLNERYRKLTATLEEEKMEDEQGGRKFWWEEEIEVEKMGKEELECYVRALGEVKSNVEKILMEKKSNIHVSEKKMLLEESSNMKKILMEKGYFVFPNSHIS